MATRFPFLKDTPFLIACSGGLDSTVLAHLCLKCGYPIGLAHCNFKLRETESDGDEKFVEKLSKAWGIPYYGTSFETKKEILQVKGSVQMVARELRYDWFAKLVQETKFEYVLSAHHLDDSLETFIINLSRGTGIDGLNGIPERHNHIIRPLLPFQRAQILAYAKNQNLRWREDSSNASDHYLRNTIRHKVVPELKELNPSFLDNFQKTQGFLHDSSLILENAKKELQSRLFKEKEGVIQINIENLKKLNPLLPNLQLLLREFGFTAWQDIVRLLDATSGKEINSQTHRLLKDRQLLLLSPLKTQTADSICIPKNSTILESPVRMKITEVEEIRGMGINTIFVDAEKIGFPLLLRKWKTGDYFYPFGMRGRKKVSKYFKDEKMSILDKEEQWVLCSGEKIIWILGRRADHRFRVTSATKNIMKLEILT